jgi:hypothetical protein
MSNAASSVAVTCTLPTPYSVVARAVVATEPSVATLEKAGTGNGSSRSYLLDSYDANEQDLPSVTRPETIIVTVSY